MHVAAKALAFTAIDLLGHPALLKQARAAFTPARAK
jgi:hypothetical protein